MIPRYNPHEFHDVLLEVEDISTNGQPYEEYAGELPSVELHTLNIPTWLKTLVRFGEDVNAATVYPSRSEALFDAVQGLIKHRIDDRTSMSLLLDPRYAISEKPREQGRKWVAGELARGRAKLNGYQRPHVSPPETDASHVSDAEDHLAQDGDRESASKEEAKPPRKSQATLLVELAGDAELWHARS